jgi:hypothetical protein
VFKSGFRVNNQGYVDIYIGQLGGTNGWKIQDGGLHTGNTTGTNYLLSPRGITQQIGSAENEWKTLSWDTIFTKLQSI